ncbi:RHS repeat domain-containing protein [Pirellulaceae bacterium SH449]
MTNHPTITSAAPSSASLPFDAVLDSIDSLTTTFTASVVPTLETTTVTEVALGYHRNQQYSITAMTTSSGAVAERYAYTAYEQPTILNASGTVLTSSAVGNRYTYTGREWDETLGLHHFRARWMSPLAGRFLGRDPIGYGDGMNLNAILVNGLMDCVDPSGECADCKQRGGTPFKGGGMLVDSVVDSEIDEYFDQWVKVDKRKNKDIPEIERRRTRKTNPRQEIHYVIRIQSYTVICCKEKDGSMTFETYRRTTTSYQKGTFRVPRPWELDSQNKDKYVNYMFPVPFWYHSDKGYNAECLKTTGLGTNGFGPRIIDKDSDIK